MADIEMRPLEPARWLQVERLFASCGDARHCWCAYWYRPNKDFQAGKGAGNRENFRRLIEAGTAHGMLACDGEEAVGFCHVAPRAAQDRLREGRSRVLAAVDDQPVWSMNCFVIDRRWRRKGLMRRLIGATVEHARDLGATLLEAYPLDAKRKIYGGELYVGSLAAFLDTGFREVARRSAQRPIVRRSVR